MCAAAPGGGDPGGELRPAGGAGRAAGPPAREEPRRASHRARVCRLRPLRPLLQRPQEPLGGAHRARRRDEEELDVVDAAA